jgi:hypothetical protein
MVTVIRLCMSARDHVCCVLIRYMFPAEVFGRARESTGHSRVDVPASCACLRG